MKKIILAALLLTGCAPEKTPETYSFRAQEPEEPRTGTIDLAVFESWQPAAKQFEKILRYQEFRPSFCTLIGFASAHALAATSRWETWGGSWGAKHEVQGMIHDSQRAFENMQQQFLCKPELWMDFENMKAFLGLWSIGPSLAILHAYKNDVGIRLTEPKKPRELAAIGASIRERLANDDPELGARNACLQVGVLAFELQQRGREDSTLWWACGDKYDRGKGIEKALRELGL